MIRAALAKHGRRDAAKIMGDIPGYHASPEDAARAARDAGVRALVFYHLVPSVPAGFMERAFVGDEASLIRVIGMALAVIGWFYVFGGRSGARQIVAASVIDRVTLVPLVLLPLAAMGVFPMLFLFFGIADPALGLCAWMLMRKEGRT